MDSSGFTLRWEEDSRGQSAGVVSEDVICSMDGSVQQHFNNIDGSNSHLTNESIIADTDQIAAENLIFLAQDIVGQISGYAETAQYRSDGYSLEQAELEQGDEVECQVTEEIITDDWVQPGGQEQVEVPLEQLVMITAEPTNEENSIDVPLPTDQDEYTAMRPYPCDFCSRRFRKKTNLMNHMVAHQNDRPFGCNLCGTRYGRRSDLLNHLKSHATVPEDVDDTFNEFEPIMEESPPRRRHHRRRSPHSIKNDDYSFINDMETSVAARTQQYDANAASSSMRNINQYQITDPSRPFVCQHCGIGFAREKALASHARIHGGDSPIECGICGEMCWSREQLTSHTKNKHPHRTPQAISPPHGDFSSDSSFTDEYVEKTIDTQPVGPELICKDCGVGFQRADLLRRHVRAAHRYKMESQNDLQLSMGDSSLRDDDNDPWGTNEHSCSQCGERFREPLDLLAHAGTHAGQRGMKRSSGAQRDKSVDCNVCGERFPDKMALISHRHIHSGNSKQFPCRECGKTFGSRSSQQIHERIHTGERPYSCRFCWKAFADGGTLRKHERIHTGEKPYACAVCPRAFNQRVVLREHVRSHHSAADGRRGTATTPFWCPVCGQLFASSVDLIQHIIGHCDANTAMKRQPQVGPRKYKRRRKTMPFDDDMNKDDEKIDSDMSGQEEEEEMIDEELPSPKRQSTSAYRRSRKNRSSPQSSGDEMEAIRASLEKSSRMIESSISGSARTKGKSKSRSHQDIQRPKMIHTQRTKVADGESFAGKRKKRMTKTTITTTSTFTSNPIVSEERVRARIKNVKLPGDGRLPKASFSTSVKPEPETESDIADDLTAILHGAEQLEEVEEEIIDDVIYEDPKNIKKEPSHDNHEAQTQSTIKVKCEKDDANLVTTSMTSAIEGVNSETGPFRCEMCSESFPLREELLIHVPIHIT